MVRLFVRHTVADYEAWRRAYDDFDAARRPMGVTDDAVFQAIDNPNEVTVWHDFTSAEAARAFASSEELKDVMQQAGVQGQPQVWFDVTRQQSNSCARQASRSSATASFHRTGRNARDLILPSGRSNARDARAGRSRGRTPIQASRLAAPSARSTLERVGRRDCKRLRARPRPSVELPSQTGKLAHDTMLCVERHAEQAPYRVSDVFELAVDGCWMSRSLRNLYDAPP